MRTMKAVTPVNTEMLNWCILKQGLTAEKLSVFLSIPEKRLEGLLNGKYEFYTDEIVGFKTILALSDSQFMSIFCPGK